MSHTVIGKLKRDARSFPTANGQGFSVSISKPFRDNTSDQTQWTQYEAVLFASTPKQIEYYQSRLVAGSVISLTAKEQKIKFSGENSEYVSIELLFPTLEVEHWEAPGSQYRQAG